MPHPIRWPADAGPSTRWTIYTRGNVGEVYPDVVLPLEADLTWAPAERGWRNGAAEIGFAVPDDFGDEPAVVMGTFGGYTYFNVSLMRLLGVRTPGASPDLVDAQFLGEADVPGYSPQPGDRRLSATLRVMRSALSTLRAKDVPRLDRMRERAESLRSSHPGLGASDAELLEYVSLAFSGSTEFFIGNHVVNTMQATVASGALSDFCEKHLGDADRSLELTTGLGDVISAEPAREMWKIANETAADDEDEAFASFLERYGHRGPNEFSLNGRDWTAHPQIAAAAIDTMRGLDASRSPERQARAMVEKREAGVRAAKLDLSPRRRRQLDRLIESVALWSRAREQSKDIVVWGNQLGRHAFIELVRRAAERGGVADRDDTMLLTLEEFTTYLDDPPSMVPTIEERRVTYRELSALEPPFAFDSADYEDGFPPISTWARRRTVEEPGEVTHVDPGTEMAGAAGAPGTATGRARIVHDPADPRGIEPGDVLVTKTTDPSWTPLFVGAAAVVVEVGAAMSHSMIVSRELGIPCVVGVDDATLKIPDGSMLEVNGTNGTVTMR